MNHTPLAFSARRVAWAALPALATLVISTVRLPAAVDPATENVDKLLEDGLRKANLKPNPPASDEVFVRRLYVDIAGRIPTAQEASVFLNSKAPDKRAHLIDQLLASEAYASNYFNYWADILRLKSNVGNNNNVMAGTGDVYATWVKDQLRKNLPYNEFVKALLTAQGYLWDNGAVGYYMRDAGMPLDNMANTCQIFLGTRVACAQCHNHPFDSYHQKDFYEMAAYTCGMDTRVTPKQILADASGKAKMTKKEAAAQFKPGVEKVLESLLEPLSYGTRENPEKKMTLPEDFRGDPKNPDPRHDGKPNDPVKAEPVFGKHDDIKVKGGKILENYADWFTSQDNPTFTVMIANRLWKQVMGLGLIEPVDDIKKIDIEKNEGDVSKLASNPALMSFLTAQIKVDHYDMKKFLRMLFNSRAYQRETTTMDVTIEDYKFPGPVLRRMTAEQLWDSLVTMVIPYPDERKRSAGYMKQLSQMKASAEALADKLKSGSAKSLLSYAEGLAKVEMDFDKQAAPARKKLADARTKNDKDAVAAAQKEIDKIESDRFDARKKLNDEQNVKMAKNSSDSIFDQKKPVGMMPADKMKKDEPIVSAADDGRWQGYGGEWVRASELPSPAPEGHFLREFGQSERDIIQHSNTDATVIQALSLLNGPLFDQLTAQNTQLGKILGGLTTPDEKRDSLFLTILSRPPRESEKALVAKQVQADGMPTAFRKIAWALLNTREFNFVQ